MSPGYSLTVQGVMSNDRMFWGVIMLVITVVALASGGVRDKATDPRACRNCGYNLTGNQTGACPECGAAIPGKQLSLLR